MDVSKHFGKNVSHRTAKALYKSKSTRFFFVRGFSAEILYTALKYNVWGTRISIERDLLRSYNDRLNVLLFFGCSGTGSLFGYALMKSRPGDSRSNRSNFSNKFDGPLFDIEWLRCLELPESAYGHLKNKYNSRKPLSEIRDGHEIDGDCAFDLCRLFEKRYRELSSSPKPAASPAVAPAPTPPQAPLKRELSHSFLLPQPQFGLFPPVGKGLQLKGASVYSLDMASEFNPALLIFPVDLSNMSYDTYISLYNCTFKHWIETPEDFEIPQLAT